MINSHKGFTLIELMIVLAIVGILATFALPAYQNYTARAQISEAILLASSFKTKVTEYYSQAGECPGNANGISLASSISGTYVLKVEVSTGSVCTITATMKSKGTVSGGAADKKLRLTMKDSQGSYTWTCTSDADQQLLPTACKNSPIT